MRFTRVGAVERVWLVRLRRSIRDSQEARRPARSAEMVIEVTSRRLLRVTRRRRYSSCGGESRAFVSPRQVWPDSAARRRLTLVLRVRTAPTSE